MPVQDVKQIEDVISVLKKLQRETRQSIKALREYQELKKGERKNGISGQARRGVHRQQPRGGN
jgi:hydroxypyruvate isomerase